MPTLSPTNKRALSPPPAASKKLDYLSVAAILGVLFLYFYKVVLFRKSISRVAVLPEWDSVFDQWRTGHVQSYDPSLVQIFIPDYLFAAKKFCAGIMPLWNSHSGFGYPFLADIQTSVFAPMRVLFDFFPNLYTYNLYLITELAVCAVTAFFLARALGLSRLAAIFASTTYTFCPYNLWYSELNLGSAASLFPLTALSFAHAANRRNVESAILAGLACSLLIISGHPECAFFGIVFSSILMLLLFLFNSSTGRLAPPQLLPNLVKFTRSLFIAGISAFCFSAPILLPFVEYLLNAESYKYGSAYSTPVTWNSILFNLANPSAGAASPYLGIIAAVLLPLAILYTCINWKREAQMFSVLLLSAITFALVAQLGPIQQIFYVPPLTTVITRYALPYLLMLFAILAARGFELIQSFMANRGFGLRTFSVGTMAKSLAAIVVLIISAVFFFSFSAAFASNSSFMKACDFDAMLPASAFNPASWRRDQMFLLIAFAFSILSYIAIVIKSFARQKHSAKFLSHGNGIRLLAILVPLTLLTLSCLSEGSIAKNSLPDQNKFFYPPLELANKIADPKFRTISLVEHVFRPATNSVYGINFLQVHNPLFPKRFLDFVKAAGAKTDTFNQKFEKVSSPLLGLASVKYILSIDTIDQMGMEKIFEYPNQIKVYENKNATPRVFIVPSSVEVADGAAALERLNDPSTEFKSTVILEPETKSNSKVSPAPVEQRNLPASISGDSSATSTAASTVDSFLDNGSNKIKLSCNAEADCWLVLTDIFYPGWNAYVDGTKTQIRRANFAFRAIPITKGQHNVEFVYEPSSFALGLGLFAVFSILVFAYQFLKKPGSAE